MKTDFLYFFIFFQTPFENLAKAINFATRKKNVQLHIHPNIGGQFQTL